MTWLEWFKNFWSYSKSERKGVLFLIMLIVVVYSSPYILELFREKTTKQDRTFEKEVARFQKEVKKKKNQSSKKEMKENRKLNPFPFNPNRLTRQQAKKLGLPDHVIDNILKYRQEGGQFHEPQDFAEVYGLADSTYKNLKPYLKISKQYASGNNDPNEQKQPFQPDTLFNFDPNDLPITKWRQLGLSDQVILNIKSYEEQGGYFQTKDDLADIYGMKQEMFAELAPYMQLDNERKPEKHESEKPNGSSKDKTAKVDINNADSLDLLNVRGIGPFYAKMILRERRELGGFVYKEQVKDVYGMQKTYGNDSLTVYQKIRERITVGPVKTEKININAASVDSLADHPYIDYNLAQTIVNYRKQHGSYDSMADVNELYLVSDDLSRKLAPYLQLP